MIIGISGKKTVGKDTVGKIIQYLTGESTVYPFDLNIDYSHKSNWEVKKFADKLKDIICILVNCNREQLENETFKSKELGEEWWYWYMELDGGYSPIILDYLTSTKKELKSYEGLELIKPTPRFLLQFIGTDLLRNQLHPEIWVNSLMSEYKPYSKGTAHDLKNWSEVYRHTSCKNCGKQYSGWKRQYLCKECIEDDSVQFYPNWIITDVRFTNELEAVKRKGGITIRVNKGSTQYERYLEFCKTSECTYSDLNSEQYPMSFYLFNRQSDSFKNRFLVREHESETELDNAEFDYVIDNNGTINELVEKVREILIKEKLL